MNTASSPSIKSSNSALGSSSIDPTVSGHQVSGDDEQFEVSGSS
jgi:hypothetical protein